MLLVFGLGASGAMCDATSEGAVEITSGAASVFDVSSAASSKVVSDISCPAMSDSSITRGRLSAVRTILQCPLRLSIWPLT